MSSQKKKEKQQIKNEERKHHQCGWFECEKFFNCKNPLACDCAIVYGLEDVSSYVCSETCRQKLHIFWNPPTLSKKQQKKQIQPHFSK